MRRWRCCHAVGGWRKTRLEEEGAEGVALSKLEVDDWTRGGGADNTRQAGSGQLYITTRGWGCTT